MRRRRFGRTGLEVSEISLGTAEIGFDYGMAPDGRPLRPPEEEAARLLDRALDLGINLVDTARVYGDAEAIIGRALAGRRHEYVLVTKVGSFPHEPDRRTRIRDSVEESLRALRTDAVDILLLHAGASEIVPHDDVSAELLHLRDRGMTRYLGISVYGMEAALASMRLDWCDCLQIAYSVLDRRPELSVLGEAGARDVGIMLRSVLLRGALGGCHRQLPDALRSLKDAAEALTGLAAAAGLSLPEAAFRYVLARSEVHTALVGARDIREMEEAVAWAGLGPLDTALASALRAIMVADESLLSPANWPPA
ncbi:MAG: aldo/keto reductase [Bryobacterales bacterium]|nr:aldo/keto reductase [Bryobacterales bacterium]